MSERPVLPQINMSKTVVGGGIGGGIFAIATMSIFFTGIPLVRYMFPASIALGTAIAVALHFTQHEKSSTSRILG